MTVHLRDDIDPFHTRFDDSLGTCFKVGKPSDWIES